MPQSYATRTGEASCELPESQQAPPEPRESYQHHLQTEDCFQVRIQPENSASKVLGATES